MKNALCWNPIVEYSLQIGTGQNESQSFAISVHGQKLVQLRVSRAGSNGVTHERSHGCYVGSRSCLALCKKIAEGHPCIRRASEPWGLMDFGGFPGDFSL